MKLVKQADIPHYSKWRNVCLRKTFSNDFSLKYIINNYCLKFIRKNEKNEKIYIFI